MMIDVTCPKCKETFQHEKPEADIVINCPYCSAEIDLYVSLTDNALPPSEEVIQKVKSYEKISNILWLIIGALQIFVGLQAGFYLTAILGAYNIVIAVVGFNNLKNICIGNENVVEWYDKRLTWIIIFAIINLIIGGIIGVLIALFNLYTRDYALKHKYAFVGTAENTDVSTPQTEVCQSDEDLTVEEKEKVDEYIKFIKSQREG